MRDIYSNKVRVGPWFVASYWSFECIAVSSSMRIKTKHDKLQAQNSR